MKKLNEYSGEEALDIIVDIMDAVVPFMKDNEVMDAWRNKTVVSGFKISKEKYPEEFKNFIKAYGKFTDEEMKHMSAITVMQIFSSIMTDPIMMSFFASPSRKKDKESSGSATANTEAEA